MKQIKTSSAPNSRRSGLGILIRVACALVVQGAFVSTAWTKVEFDANQLRMKDSDTVNELIQKKLKKAQKIQASQDRRATGGPMAEPEAIDELKDAMRIALARPDQDGNRQHAFARVRRELSDLDQLDAVLEDLTKEAIFAIQGSDTAPNMQYTYMVLLENLMAEIKPEMKNVAFKHIVESIRDADLKVSPEAKKIMMMRSITRPSSPSETAIKILSAK